jgi:hypothetical protein
VLSGKEFAGEVFSLKRFQERLTFWASQGKFTKVRPSLDMEIP